MRFVEFLERYVFVRKCVCCNERLGYEYREDAFCDACRISFERAKAENCPECMMAMADCRCIPKRLADGGVLAYRKLFAYRKSEDVNPENKLVYFLKNYKSRRAAIFASKQLLPKLDELLCSVDISREDIVLTYIPRSRKSYAKYGVDQAKLVALTLGELTDIECLPLIKRVHDGKKAQKKLGIRQRLKNTEGMFAFNEKCADKIGGRSVVIYDDVVTTGASVLRAVSVLKKYGIDRIYLLSMAYTAKE